MATIEKNWDDTASAIKAAVGLISKYGFNRDSLTASTAIIPIAYFIFKNKLDAKILHHASCENDRRLIMEWLSRVLLSGTFGGTPDAIYPVIRTLITENPGRFPLPEIIAHYRGKRKSISFSEDDIESLLDIQYGQKRAYSALTLVYSSLNYSFKYHQDHIHPKSFFNKRKLGTLGIEDDKVKDEFISKYNSLANLQLLEATENIEKKDNQFMDWLNEKYQNDFDKMNYLSLNHIANDTSLEFTDFIHFYDTRRATLKSKLMQLLNVKAGEVLTIELETE